MGLTFTGQLCDILDKFKCVPKREEDKFSKERYVFLSHKMKSQLSGKILQNHLQCGFIRLCVVRDLEVNVPSVISRGDSGLFVLSDRLGGCMLVTP